MSEFNCPEPGCMFHIGIAGDLVTSEDFEAQDYYDQEIEEHQQMHEKQKSEEAKRSDANFDLKLDQAITAAEAEFEAAKEKLDTVAQKIAFEIAVGGDLQGPRYDYLLVRDRSATAVGAVGALRKLKKELSSAQTGEDSAYKEGSSGSRVPRVETDRRSRGNEKGGRVSVSVLDLNSRDTVLLESINNFLLDIRQILVRQIDGGPVVTDVPHEISLSVDGAPYGAGVGTSDSTERGQTPDSPEMKVPSAVAAAEGDETNNPKR